MRTRILLGSLTLMVWLAGLPARADNVELGGVTYSFTSTKKVAVVSVSPDMKNVAIPSQIECDGKTYSVETLYATAFKGCEKLESVSFPASVTKIYDNLYNDWYISYCSFDSWAKETTKALFAEAPNLRSISVEEGSTTLTVSDNILFTNKNKTLLAYPCGDERETLEVPAGIECVAPIDNSKLKTIVFTDTLMCMFYMGENTNLSEVFVKNKHPYYLGGKFPEVLHVPQGTGRTYAHRSAKEATAKMTKILEEGNNIPFYFTTEWWPSTDYSLGSPTIDGFYDSDGDGIIELHPRDKRDGRNMMGYVHSGTSDFLIPKEDKSHGRYADVDCDGLTDLVTYFSEKLDNDVIKYQQRNGTFSNTVIHIVENEPKYVKTITGNVPFQMFANVPDPSSAIPPVPMLIEDINNDGICDIFNSRGGKSYLSFGKEATFCNNGAEASLFPCDLNGDGLTDFVGIHENKDAYIMLCQMDGGYTEKTLFANQNLTCNNIFLRDFNHDGYLDILLPFEYRSTIYFIFFKNNGDGTFSKKEQTFDIEVNSYITILQCCDMDNDGCYEFFYEKNAVNKKILKIKQNFSLEPLDLHPDFEGINVVADFNNDGWMEVLYMSTDNYKYYLRSWAFQQSVNTAPKKMAKPTAVYNSDLHRLHITWPKGEDAETSVCDLTYELRIGSAPGLGDYYYGRADANGVRKTLEEGNMGRKNMFLYNTHHMTEGTYYISVQAVDGGGLGGPWSDCFVYEHHLEAPIIVCNKVGYAASTDVLVFKITNFQPDATYRWDCPEDAEIVEQSGDSLAVRFNTAGDHSVRVEENLQGRTLVSDAISFYVNPFSNKSYGHGGGILWDANQDGFLDEWNNLLYANDGTDFTLVKKSFNTESISHISVLDYNMDGVPDFIGDAPSANLYLNISEGGDYDFDLSSVDIYCQSSGTTNKRRDIPYYRMSADLNNDGLLDWVNPADESWNKHYYASGDALHYVEFSGGYFYYDVNRDGFIDRIYNYINDGNTYNICVQFKKPTAEMTYDDPQIMFEEVPRTDYQLVDLNNDGYLDCIYTTKTGTLYKHTILPGTSQFPCKKKPIVIETTETSGVTACPDFDNNGFWDLVGKENSVYYYFYPNFRYEKRYASGGAGGTQKTWVVFKPDGYPSSCYGNIKNEAPQAPTGVVARQTAEGLLITWNDAVDDKTPAMQMRYNISVKRKGKTGDNSFVISPMNGLKDNVPLLNAMIYPKATRYLVPSTALTAGETYEVQVQALDLWGVQSPMSPVAEVTVNGDGYVDVAEQVAVGEATLVKFVGAQGTTVTLDPGADGTIVSQNGNEYHVSWSTPGQKEIIFTVNGIRQKTAILVKQKDDVTLAPIETVYAQAPYTYRLPAVFADYAGQCSLTCSDTKNVVITWEQGDSTATLLFKKVGSYTLQAASENGVCSNKSELVVNVTSVIPEAGLNRVDCMDGHYALSWNTAEFAGYVTDVNIYKETTNLDEYVKLATLPINEGRYVDTGSDPRVKSERYKVSFVCTNGQETNLSQVYQPLHVMVSKAIADGYNLMWNDYKGMKVNNYTILRGTSPDTMEEVGRVSGSITNYTDLTTNEGTVYYYGVSFTPQSASQARAVAASIMSNVVSTQSAVDFVPIDSLIIICERESVTGMNDNLQELQFYAGITPLNATSKNVRWWLEGGEGYVEINDNGRVYAVKEGIARFTIHAEALDGSGCSDTYEMAMGITVTEPFSISYEKTEVEVGEILTINLYNVNGYPLSLEADAGYRMDEHNEDFIKLHWEWSGTKTVRIECRNTVYEFTVEVKGKGQGNKFYVDYEKESVEVGELWTLHWFEAEGNDVTFDGGEDWVLETMSDDGLVSGYWTTAGRKHVKVECVGIAYEFSIDVKGKKFYANYDKERVEVGELWTLHWFETGGNNVAFDGDEGWVLETKSGDGVSGYWTTAGEKHVKAECAGVVCEFSIDVYETTPDPEPQDYTSRLGNLLSKTEWKNDQLIDGEYTFGTKQVSSPEFVNSEFSGTAFETWLSANGNLPAGKSIYRTVTQLPNGLYRLSAAVLSKNEAGTGGKDAVFYANDVNQSSYSDVTTMKYITLNDIVVHDGTLEFGINNLSPQASNWSVIADARLYYLGSEEKRVCAYQREKLRKALSEFLTLAARLSLTSDGDNLADAAAKQAQSVYTNSAASVKEIDDALSLLSEATENIQLAQLPPADFTFAIKNPDFSIPSKKDFGWSLSSGSISVHPVYPEAEFYDETFDLYQMSTKLPVGTYELTFQGFYRQGLPTSAASLYTNNREGHYAELYAKVSNATQTSPVMSIMAEALSSSLSWDEVSTSRGYIPNGMSGAYVRFIQDGYDDNKLTFVVTEKGAIVYWGLRKKRFVSSDWCIFTNFRLTYVSQDAKLPVPTDMQESISDEDETVEYFTVDGVKVDKPRSGLYLCRKRHKNGTVSVHKVIVK